MRSAPRRAASRARHTRPRSQAAAMREDASAPSRRRSKAVARLGEAREDPKQAALACAVGSEECERLRRARSRNRFRAAPRRARSAFRCGVPRSRTARLIRTPPSRIAARLHNESRSATSDRRPPQLGQKAVVGAVTGVESAERMPAFGVSPIRLTCFTALRGRAGCRRLGLRRRSRSHPH